MQLRRTVGHGQTRVVGICSHWECAACCLLVPVRCALMSIYIQKDIRAAIDEAGIKNVVNAKRLQLSGLRLCARNVCTSVCCVCVYVVCTWLM